MAGTARVLVKIGDKVVTVAKKIPNGTVVELIQSDDGVRTQMATGTIQTDTSAPPPPPPDPTKPPTVSAGEDLTVKEETLVKIDGKASADVGAIIVLCEWFQVRGPMVSVTQDENDDTNMSFITPAVEEGMLEYELEFMLRVKDDKGSTTEDHMKVIVTKDNVIIPPPPPPTDDVLWDSNRDGHWNNGQARTVTDEEGDQNADGKGIYMAASGNPKLEILGNGEANLVLDPGHGRFYGKACNYDAALVGEFCFRDKNADNRTLKIRNRHQMGGDCKNRQGLSGASIGLDGKGGFKFESCHNFHENSIPFSVGKALEIGKWYQDRFVTKDSPNGKDILLEYWFAEAGQELKLIKTGKYANAPAEYLNKAQFEQNSEFWERGNNTKPTKIGLRNVQLLKV